MAGSFDIQPPPNPLTPPAKPVHVYRYDPDATDPRGQYELLPNVYCEGVAERDGPEPTTAQFSYMLDDTLAAYMGWPCQFEDLWPMQAPESKYKVKQDDRLVVLTVLPDKSKRLLFDGFVLAPQADVSADAQAVTFAATSVEVRCWDSPIAGRSQRQGDRYFSPSDISEVDVDLPCRFNADGLPNCTGEGVDYDVGSDIGDGGGVYANFPHPVFICAADNQPGDRQSLWTLSKATRYIIARYNLNEEYVDNPDFSVLDDLLNNRVPKEGADSYDPADSATYDEHPITLSDYDASNRPWPEVLSELLSYYGFGMRFEFELDDQGLPWHHLELERRDQAGPRAPKDLLLPKVGTPLDPSAVNVGAFHVATDFRGVANRIEIESNEKVHEASFVLAPGFQPAAGDETAANAPKWFLSAASVSTDEEVRNKYRKYILDEMGQGHWSLNNSSWVPGSHPPDLSPIFPDVAPGGAGLPPTPGYVNRYRPARNSLVTVDGNKEPLKKQLHLSRDYAGPDPPCVWDGTGTWQAVTGSWELLDDRLGIYVTAQDMREWKIGKDKAGMTQEPSEKLDAVASLANPTAANAKFYLRLTTVIDGDYGIKAVADKRKASPIGFDVTRRIDARDHYAYAKVEASSAAGAGEAVVTDDTGNAMEKATQLRAAHEFPPIAGSVTIPGLDFSLQIGDRIKSINGRDVSLQVNAGAEAGEAKSYPFVVARSLSMSGDQQSTVLQLSDRRAEPAPIERRR